MKYIYVAGPYMPRGNLTKQERKNVIKENILNARHAAGILSDEGVGFFCPHTHTANFEELSTADESYYLEIDEHFLNCCDALYLLPNWQTSNGSKKERALAIAQGKPVFEDIFMAIKWAKNNA